MFASHSIREQIALFVSLGLFTYVFIANAWICDDAYITFRVVDNFINGYGLTWNIAERVQVFTHPLWMLVISLLYYFTADLFYTTIVISFLCCIASIVVVRCVLKKELIWKTPLFFLLIISSKAFIDYSTSGLENPLALFLIIVFYSFIFSRAGQQNSLTDRELAGCVLIAALIFLNRQDTLLLCLPVLTWLIAAHSRTRRFKTVPVIIIAAAPVIVWSVFSLLYYGFPLPNTAYAKLGTGIPAFFAIDQGLAYYQYTMLYDPLTLIIIFLAAGVLLRKQLTIYIMSACGIILYLLYIIWIGGDFMGGRFFTVPYFLSCFLLIKAADSKKACAALVIIALCATAANPQAPVKSTLHYSGIPSFFGIHDERAFYCPYTGLLARFKHGEIKQKWYLWGKAAKEKNETVLLFHAIGLFGFAAGPQKYIIDDFALSDPLLARLPADDREKIKPGHFKRALPEGYMESAQRSQNLIKDPYLHRYYEIILNITRGPIFSRERFMDIVYMNLGKFDYLITAYLENKKRAL